MTLPPMHLPLPPFTTCPPPPIPSCKQHHQDNALLNWMQGLMRAGACRLDTLSVSQLAAQEASGVMAAAMLWQQGTMWEVPVWESEVEAVMRVIVRVNWTCCWIHTL